MLDRARKFLALQPFHLQPIKEGVMLAALICAFVGWFAAHHIRSGLLGFAVCVATGVGVAWLAGWWLNLVASDLISDQARWTGFTIKLVSIHISVAAVAYFITRKRLARDRALGKAPVGIMKMDYAFAALILLAGALVTYMDTRPPAETPVLSEMPSVLHDADVNR